MNIGIDIERKFIINGKEYKSIEEIPHDIPGARESFRNLIGPQVDSDYRISSALTPTKIIFNGTEYETIESMPQDVRQLYEEVLKEAQRGTPPSGVHIEGITSGMLEKPATTSSAPPGETGKQPKGEPSFFLPTFLMSAGLMALFLLIHYLLQTR